MIRREPRFLKKRAFLLITKFINRIRSEQDRIGRGCWNERCQQLLRRRDRIENWIWSRGEHRERLAQGLLMNMISHDRGRSRANLIQDLCGLGSTSAAETCLFFGYDPDEKVRLR